MSLQDLLQISSSLSLEILIKKFFKKLQITGKRSIELKKPTEMLKYKLFKFMILLLIIFIFVYLSLIVRFNSNCSLINLSPVNTKETKLNSTQTLTYVTSTLSSKFIPKVFTTNLGNDFQKVFVRLFPGYKFLTILMITDDVSDDVSVLSMNDKYEYAFKHKYGLLIDNNRVDRPASWSKIISILNLFEQGHEWVWSLDRDTIIANPNIEVEKLLRLIDKKYSLVMSIDCNTINAGSFFIRKSNWTIDFLNKVFNTYGNEVSTTDVWYENKALYLFHKRNESGMLNKIYLVPQWSINIYPSENQGCRVNGRYYEHGDFVIHFAGLMRSGAKKDLYKRYFDEIRQKRSNLSEHTTELWLRKMNLSVITNIT
jgi:hypothetical protein